MNTNFNNESESQWPLDDLGLLDHMKYEDTLKDFACLQIESTQDLSAIGKRNLVSFFTSTIINDPQERASNLKDLVILFGHSWYDGDLQTFSVLSTNSNSIGNPVYLHWMQYKRRSIILKFNLE